MSDALTTQDPDDWCVLRILQLSSGGALIPNFRRHGVSDPKKRKQIQDRLAQRARSKLLKRILTMYSLY